MSEPIVPIEDLRDLEHAANNHPWRTFWRLARRIAKANGLSTRVLVQESVAAGCLHTIAAHDAAANADPDDATRLETVEGAVDELVGETQSTGHRISELAGEVEQLRALVAVLLAAAPDASALIRELTCVSQYGYRTEHHTKLELHGLVVRDHTTAGEIDHKPSALGDAAICAHDALTQH